MYVVPAAVKRTLQRHGPTTTAGLLDCSRLRTSTATVTQRRSTATSAARMSSAGSSDGTDACGVPMWVSLAASRTRWHDGRALASAGDEAAKPPAMSAPATTAIVVRMPRSTRAEAGRNRCGSGDEQPGVAVALDVRLVEPVAVLAEVAEAVLGAGGHRHRDGPGAVGPLGKHVLPRGPVVEVAHHRDRPGWVLRVQRERDLDVVRLGDLALADHTKLLDQVRRGLPAWILPAGTRHNRIVSVPWRAG